ncbi:MAG: DUF6677 family protein [Thermoguttaceae bacterium]
MPNELDSGQEITVDLKNPVLAGVLAWLVPGLGHFYQGRTAKGIVFCVCILSIFAYGVYLGGSSELGWGRAVFASWRQGYRRLPYLCQIGVGLAAAPALLEAQRAAKGKKPFLGGFMAPPLPQGDPRAGRRLEALKDQPTLDELHRRLHRYFDMGTAYTMIAGLLNVLVIYDACCGPVLTESRKDEEEEDLEQPDHSEETV